MRARNPAFKPFAFEPPKFVEKAKAARVDPDAGLPWRLFEQAFSTLCRNHEKPVMRPVSFVVARSRATADRVFAAGNGLCPTCMMLALLSPRIRIQTTDGGRPNPAVSKVQFAQAKPVKPRDLSPYRLWVFRGDPSRPTKCACGKDRWLFYVIAKDVAEAEKRVSRYGMCALCMGEYLTYDRFIIQTTDGGPP